MNIILFERNEIKRDDGKVFIEIPLSDERAIHCRKILHKNEGDEMEAGIAGERRGKAKILRIHDGAMSVEFLAADEAETPLLPISLIVGFPRPIQLRRILRSLVSLGVSEILLCGTELGEKSYLQSSLASGETLRKMLLDGAMQAKSALISKVELFESMKVCLEQKAADWKTADKFCLDCEKETPLPSFFDIAASRGKLRTPVVLAIGSERGWTESEQRLFDEAEFRRVKMGERILRTETAAVSAATLAELMVKKREK